MTGCLPTCAGQPISRIDIWCIIVVVCGAGDWLQLVMQQFLIFLCMLCWSLVHYVFLLLRFKVVVAFTGGLIALCYFVSFGGHLAGHCAYVSPGRSCTYY